MKFKKIYVEITNICNLNCSFCVKTKRKKEEISIENFKHILKEIKPFTNYIYLHIEGEPLMHTKLDELLLLCDKVKINVNITTNGTLLKEKIDILKRHPSIRQINISLHCENNNKNYFTDIFKSVDDLSNIKISYRIWIKESKDLIINKLEEEYGKKVLDIINTNNIKIKNNLYLNKSEEFIWPNLNNNYYCSKGRCLGLKSHIGILVDGTVVICCLDALGISNLGNIYEDSLENILKSEKIENIISSFNDNKAYLEICKKCSYKERFKCN